MLTLDQIQKLNASIINTAISLMKCYDELKCDVPSEFLEDNLTSFIQHDEELLKEENLVKDFFLSIMKFEKFLKTFIQDYYRKLKRIIQTDKYVLVVLTYIIVFFTNEDNLNTVAELLLTAPISRVIQLTSFIGTDSGLLLLTQAATTYFDQEYVKETILKSVLENKDIFKKLRANVLKNKRVVEPTKKRCTKPQHMKVLTHVRKVPKPPCNSRDKENERIPARRIPDSTYLKPKIPGKIKQTTTIKQKEDKKFQSITERLLKCLLPQKRPPPPQAVVPTPSLIKATPMPVFKEPSISIKPTAATVLRQAARIVKEEEKEIKRVKNLVVGASDYTQFEKLYDELKSKEDQEYLRSIKKKHLKGLLTYEEAILARRNLLEANKKKRVIYEKQKQELEKKLIEFKEIEEEKIKQLVQKSQQIHRSVYEKRQDLLEKKCKIAQEVTEESRQLMYKIIVERTAEINRKINLIRELRAFHSLMIDNKKKFDDTETMNIGLFCEMSIAELNERLVMVRAEMKEELEQRQKKIKEEKIKQQELLNQMQKVIEYNNYERQCKNQISEKPNVTDIETDDEITCLRKKLEEKRIKRKAGMI